MIETFHRDLESGKEVELKHLEKIRKIYPDAHMIDGYFKGYDIYIPSRGFGIEIKSDKKSQETGNIVVETQFNGKDSALTTTTALYWIFDTGLKSIVVQVPDLKRLVKGMNKVVFIGEGDKHPKTAYLVRQELIESIQAPYEII